MAIGRILLIGSIALFSIIAITAVIKKNRAPEKKVTGQIEEKSIPPIIMQEKIEVKKIFTKPLSLKGDLPCIDRIYQLFSKNPTSQFPIVETISYSSSVSWLAGRPAWLNDYADYYQTSSYFILHSLGAKGDAQQRIVEGNHFNVFRRDKKIEFHLLVDISRCKMGFYYFDVGTNERVLLKTYSIGLGKLDLSKPSGSLTPLGRFLLGKRVATYQLESKGTYQNKIVEMLTVFGTHWIPFEKETGSSESTKGYGLQGSPWVIDSNGQLVEDLACIGGYNSNGCIRLASKDIEELFAIVITKPTFIEIVKDFSEATLPGIEVAAPSR